MKKAIVFFTFCLFFSFSSFSQIGVNTKKNAEEAIEIKNRPLLVVLRDTDEEHKIKFNENLKTALEKVWTYSAIERYITYDEWNDIEKDKSQKGKYAIMYYTERSLQGNAPEMCLGIGLLENKILTHFVDLRFSNLPTMIIALITLQNDLETGKLNSSKIKEKSTNLIEALSVKTLLIWEKNASDELKKEMSQIYPYNYKFADMEEIEKVILTKDDKYIYMRLIDVRQRPIITTGKGTKYSSKGSDVTLIGDGYKEVTSFDYPFICLIDPSKYEFVYSYVYRGKDGISSKDIENLLKLKF